MTTTAALCRCITFDFDGVLVDSNRIKRNGFLSAMDAIGVPPEEQDALLAAAPPGDRTTMLPWLREQSALRQWLPPSAPSPARLIADYTRYCEEEVVRCSEMPGAARVLAALAARRPLYLNSATPVDTLARIVDARGWTRFFAAVMGRPASKVENFAAILTREGISASTLWFVGDQTTDLDVARAVGCRFLGYRSPESDLPEETEVLPNLLALCDLVPAV
ncbi:MAG: HAD family hydrolase [Vicinamibacterales bacterium]